MGKKYELTNKTIVNADGHTLHRIRSLAMSISIRNFSLAVAPGDLGGFIESEDNLSHEGDCWVFDEAQVYGNARMSGDAWADGMARVFENAHAFGRSRVTEHACVFGNAQIYGNTWVDMSSHVFGNAHVSGRSRIFGNARVYGNAYVGGYINIGDYTHVQGDAYIDGNIYAYIGGNTMLDHGIWTQGIKIDGNMYLISSTLEKLLVGVTWYEQEI